MISIGFMKNYSKLIAILKLTRIEHSIMLVIAVLAAAVSYTHLTLPTKRIV